jgi:hypothetical protein
MRSVLTVVVLAAAVTVVGTPVLAGNQEVADQIATGLRDSGKLSNYKIEVKYQNGTAWLKGRVQSQTQMNSALRLALQTEGVSRVINDLEINAGGGTAPKPAGRATASPAAVEVWEAVPEDPEATRADSAELLAGAAAGGTQQVPSSYSPAPARQATAIQMVPVAQQVQGAPIPAYVASGGGVAPVQYDQANLPNYAWPTYASYPNYASLTYPKQYSPTAWPYIGPFYPYPQVPLGWRKVTLEWDDGWWMLDFHDSPGLLP